MAKSVLIIGGGCNIGSIAVGAGAKAVGSVSVADKKEPTDCDH